MKKLWISSKLFAYFCTLLALVVCAILDATAALEHLGLAVEFGLPVLLGAEGFRNWAEARKTVAP